MHVCINVNGDRYLCVVKSGISVKYCMEVGVLESFQYVHV